MPLPERLTGQPAVLAEDCSDLGPGRLDALGVDLQFEKPGDELQDTLDLLAPLSGDSVKRGFALVAAEVHVGLVPDEQLDDIRMAKEGRAVKGYVVVPVRAVHVGPLLDE